MLALQITLGIVIAIIILFGLFITTKTIINLYLDNYYQKLLNSEDAELRITAKLYFMNRLGIKKG